MKDEFVEPKLSVARVEPSYADTLEFINSRLPEPGKMGFGKETQKMIYRLGGEVFVFDPKDLNSEIKYFTSKTEQGVLGAISDCRVVLQTRAGRNSIQHWMSGAPDRETTDSFTIETADAVETKRLVNAFQHLIVIFGGKKDAF